MANTNYPTSDSPQGSTERNQTTVVRRDNSTKNIAIGVLAAALLGTWGYFLWNKNQTDDKIQMTQAQANTAMSGRDSVQFLYNDALTRLDSITGNNNNLQGQLSESQSEISKLRTEIDKIMRNKNATAGELRRAKNLIAQLNGKIANLEVEVARLTGENQELVASNTLLTEEKEVLTTNLQTTSAEKEELAKTVDKGSTFSASNIRITPIQEKRSGKQKETSTAKRVDRLDISFDVENRIARSGPADLYVIVTAPDGKVISDPSMGSGTLTTREDGDKPFTFKSAIQYEQGSRKSVSVPLRQNDFQTGDYRIEIYQNGFKIAEQVRTLKKGGLFG